MTRGSEAADFYCRAYSYCFFNASIALAAPFLSVLKGVQGFSFRAGYLDFAGFLSSQQAATIPCKYTGQISSVYMQKLAAN